MMEGPLLTVCAWCARVRATSGEWRTADAVEARPIVTHGICPDCLEEENRREQAAGPPPA